MNTMPKVASLALLAASMTAGCAAPGDGAAPADTAAALASASSVPVCRIVLEKIRPGESESRVYSRDCYDRQQEMLAAKKVEPFASTLLMTWYADINFGGRSTFIEGKDGPCDHSGYGIRNVDGWAGGWNDVISSFKSWNHCNVTWGYTDINYGGLSQKWYNPYGANSVDALEVSWVGTPENDKISSFRVLQQ
jgi:hypothetical protein